MASTSSPGLSTVDDVRHAYKRAPAATSASQDAEPPMPQRRPLYQFLCSSWCRCCATAWAVVLVVLLAAYLIACATSRSPIDCTSMIVPEALQGKHIVFVHGYLGSQFSNKDTGALEYIDAFAALNIASPARFGLPFGWDSSQPGTLATESAAFAAGGFPGSSAQFVNSTQAHDGMVVDGVVEEVAIGCIAVEVYRKPLEWLRQCHVGSAPGSELTVFAYDWRRDVLESADRLVQTLQSLSRAGSPKPIVVGHSMGGIMTLLAMRTCADCAAGVVYAGVPFPASPGSFYKQDDVGISINPSYFPGSDVATWPGPFIFNPTYTNDNFDAAFVDPSGAKIGFDPMDIDDTWLQYGFLAQPERFVVGQPGRSHLQRVLARARAARILMSARGERNASSMPVHPPSAVLMNNKLRANGNVTLPANGSPAAGGVSIDRVPGDGSVRWTAAMLPPDVQTAPVPQGSFGVPGVSTAPGMAHVVLTENGHQSLLSDVAAFAVALGAVAEAA